MIYNIELKKEDAIIEFGKSDIWGKYKQSPNGEYYIICDTLYTPSTSAEYIFVFTSKDVLYKKAIPGDINPEWFKVFDDGGSIIVTEEVILSIGPDGKQTVKKKIPGFEACDLVGNTLYVVGENNDGCKFLLLFDIDSKTTIQQVIPNIEYEENTEDEECEEKETQYSSNTEMLFTGAKFVFVYENETDAIAFDLNGNKVAPTATEVETANVNRREKIRKYNIDRAKTSYEYWSKRLEQSINEKKTVEEIERAELETKKYGDRLLNLGIQISEPAVSVCTKPPAKKKLPLWVIIIIAIVVVLALAGIMQP